MILGIRRGDFKSAAAMALIIALAFLLGWMMGRAGWNMAVNRAQSQTAAAPENSPDPAQIATNDPPTSPAAEEAAPAKQVQSSPAPANPPIRAPKPKIEVVEPDGGLVIFEQGKVVFQTKPAEKTSISAEEADSIQTEFTGNSPATSSQGSREGMDRLLIMRVAPVYPEEARGQHIQGPVVMKAVIATDGSVRDLTAISGDPQLAKAAAEAVRQWRFQPHLLNHKPVEFETQITMVFTLR